MTQVQYPKVYLYRRLVQAKLYIDARYAEAIDLDNITWEAHFSKFHFIRLFKKIYGQTPYQYLTSVRIKHAKLLLEEGQSVTDTCYAVGFDSLSSFTGLFKRTAGLSPSVYRQQQMNRKAECLQRPLKFIPGCFASKRGWINSNFEEAVL